MFRWIKRLIRPRRPARPTDPTPSYVGDVRVPADGNRSPGGPHVRDPIPYGAHGIADWPESGVPPSKRTGKFWTGLETEDGRIETHHPVFQLGRTLYDAQRMIADAEKGRQLDPKAVREMLEEFCYVIHAVGLLRAHYGQLWEEIQRMKNRVRGLLD